MFVNKKKNKLNNEIKHIRLDAELSFSTAKIELLKLITNVAVETNFNKDKIEVLTLSNRELQLKIKKYNNLMKQKECKCFRLTGSNKPFQTYLCEIHKNL